jgi:hypothetical protein
MKITPWKKYHYIFFGGYLISVLTMAIVANFGQTNISVIAFIIIIIATYVLKGRIVCPNCNAPLKFGHSLIYGSYKGFDPFLPEQCIKCGAQLNNGPNDQGGSLVDDMGSHEYNQKLPGRKHLDSEKADSKKNGLAIYPHRDVFDPLMGPIEIWKHKFVEVEKVNKAPDPKPQPADDRAPDWGRTR